MLGRIFISYRREDASADARSIYQHLVRFFGASRIFMDVDTIEKGRDFTLVLDEHLRRSNVMLAVIGNRWLSAADETGARRLDDPKDFVRLEIAHALERGLPIIPVLVGGARLPAATELPDDLKPLTKRQATTLTHENFARDVEGLERDIKRLLGIKARWGWGLFGLLTGAVLAAMLEGSDISKLFAWLSGGPR